MGLTRYLRKLGRRAPLDRERVAGLYLRGDGIEIGALNLPLRVPSSARVRYVDRMSIADLRGQYPELEEETLVEPDVLDDGERLSTFEDRSLDFVIANHFIEHCANPVAAVENFLRVLRPGGVLYLAIPDKRFTFDRDREPTTVEHLLRDYREGPEWSRRQHFVEWARLVDGVEEGEPAERAAERLMGRDYSIHFHCWTQAGMLRWLAAMRDDLGFPFDVELFLKRDHECVFVLRKAES